MKKKILCSLIALVTVVALVACGQKPSGGGSGSEAEKGGAPEISGLTREIPEVASMTNRTIAMLIL